MIKFYTSHCANCKILKSIMDKNEIEYEEIDDDKIYLPIAEANNIASMPFGEIDGKIMNTKQLRDYITQGGK